MDIVKILRENNHSINFDLPFCRTVFKPVSVYFLCGGCSPKNYPRKKPHPVQSFNESETILKECTEFLVLLVRIRKWYGVEFSPSFC